jgi:hypothetical protein
MEAKYICTNIDYWKRAFLIVSNIIFLGVPIYSIGLTIKNKIKKYILLPEIFFSSSIFVISSLYHFCDGGPSCSKYCILDWNILYYLDFIFSYQIVYIVFSYTVEQNLFIYKVIYLTIMLGINSIYTIYLQEKYDEYYNYGIIVFNGIIVNILRFIYFYKINKINLYIKYHFDLRAVVFGLVFSIMGFSAKILTPSDFNTYYWWGHSLWHIFIGLAIFFAFNIYDMSILFGCCIKKREIIEEGDYYRDINVSDL